MINFEISITTVQMLIPTISTGILLGGFLLYFYMWYSYRLKIYLSITIFSFLAVIFSFSESMILISSSIFRDPHLGMQFHRIEQLMGVFFLFALPYMLLHILNLGTLWKKYTELFAFTGLVIAVIITISAFVNPDSFISTTVHKDTWLKYEADYGRGQQGILYTVRDILIGLLIIFSMASLIWDMIINSRFKQLFLPSLGILLVMLSAMVDILFIYRGINYDFFPDEYFSRFSLGLTLMLVLFMSSIMREFVISSIELGKAEKVIRNSLGEREVMLREIHHRVKNNMQVMSSLLILQAEYISNDNDRNIFLGNSSRLLAMSMVHDKLYKSGDLSHINFGDYIKKLVSQLEENNSLKKEEIKFILNVDMEPLPIDTAIPCGIIIYELVSNSIKHAFKQSREKTIRIDFICNTGGIYQLRVSDNGIGFPVDLNMSSSMSFGLNIVNDLVNQLNGTIAMNTEGGAVTNIIFGTELHYDKADRKESSDASRRNHEVIIVEDEWITAAFLRKILEQEGFSVTGIFARGEDAAGFIMDNRPDLVLMDIILQGDIDGIETVKRFKSRVDTPVIFVTANSDEVLINKARDTEPGGFLIKPVVKDQLMRIIRENI